MWERLLVSSEIMLLALKGGDCQVGPQNPCFRRNAIRAVYSEGGIIEVFGLDFGHRAVSCSQDGLSPVGQCHWV